MGRRKRTECFVAGERAYLHLLNHVAGELGACPFTPRDKVWLHRRFLAYLAIYNVVLLSLVIMDNHYHLLLLACPRPLTPDDVQTRWRRFCVLHGVQPTPLEPGTPEYLAFRTRLDDVSLLLHDVEGQFTKYFNATHQRLGALWQGRFRSYRLHDLRALFQCFAYIEANALRAGLVNHPRDYRFGTYRWWLAMLGDPPILRHLRLLGGLSPAEYSRAEFFTAVEAAFDYYRALRG